MMFTLGYSSDGRFVYTPYLTPAASFGVLDPSKKTVLSEIDTAGCTLVIPWGPNRVSSICESGRLLTVSLNAQGHEALPARAPSRSSIRIRILFSLKASRFRMAMLTCRFWAGARNQPESAQAGHAYALVARERHRERHLAAGWRTDWRRAPLAGQVVRTHASRWRRLTQGRWQRDLGVRSEIAPAHRALADRYPGGRCHSPPSRYRRTQHRCCLLLRSRPTCSSSTRRQAN